MKYGLKNLETSLVYFKMRFDILIYLGVTHESDRRTDRQTNRRTELLLAIAQSEDPCYKPVTPVLPTSKTSACLSLTSRVEYIFVRLNITIC